MKNAKELLKQLTKEIPPGAGQHHNITVDGDNLVVCLMLDDRYRPVILDDSDLHKSVGSLVREVLEGMHGENGK